MIEKVILFKTHCWNSDIEMFVKKIYADISSTNIDLFILLHDEIDTIYSTISDDIKKDLSNKILVFTESIIKSLYKSGFYNMWLSNHWILMWFYKLNPNYQYYWSIEYDVRIVGDTKIIWDCLEKTDFMFVMGNCLNPNNTYKNFYTGKKLDDRSKYYGYLQIARYSNRFLNYLNSEFEQGENGQDELIIFSLANLSPFTKSNFFLQSLIKGKWTWQDKYSNYNKNIYQRYNNMDKKFPVYMFHPIK